MRKEWTTGYSSIDGWTTASVSFRGPWINVDD
jgi:hypothetical protein